MKKKLLLLSSILTFSFMSGYQAYSQNEVESLVAKSGNDLEREYLRPSLSVVYVTDGSSNSKQFISKFREIQDGKFDVNRLSSNDLVISKLTDETASDEIAKLLKAEIEEAKVANQIMENWFPTFNREQNAYTDEVLLSRGKYAATDKDVIQGQASQRKMNTVLQTLGEQLIDRSYLVFYVVRDLPKEKEPKVKLEAYAFKLDFNKEVMNDFYTNYFQKSNGVYEAKFPMVFLMNTNPNFIASTLGVGTYSVKADNLSSSIEDGYKHMNALLGAKIADFQVKSSVVEVDPVRAKIGLKEGLQTDDRYYVMEMTLDDEGKEKAERVAVVRVGGKIADNKYNSLDSINTDETKKMTNFYQIAGGEILKSQMLVQKPDLGINVTPLVGIGGIEMAVEYRATKLLGKFMKNGTIPGLFTYLKFGMPFAKPENGSFGLAKFNDSNDKLHVVYSFALGLGKEFNFARFLSASLYLGYGAYGVSGYDTSSTGFLDANLRFGWQIHPSWQIFLHGGYKYLFTNIEKSFYNDGIGVLPYNAGIGASFTL